MITYSKKIKGFRSWLGNESVWNEFVQSEITTHLIDEYRRTGDREIKLKLPVVNFQGYDPVVLDGTVGKRVKNSKLWYHPTGLFMIDVDHVDDPVSLFNRLPICLSEAGVDFRESVALVHVTSSGKGLRVVMKGRSGSTVPDDQRWLASLLGVEGDPHVVDLARWSFVPKQADILYQNSDLLFAEPFSDVYPKTVANKYAVEVFEEEDKPDYSKEVAAYNDLCDHINAGKYWKKGEGIKLTEIDGREFLYELFDREEAPRPFEGTLSKEYKDWQQKAREHRDLIRKYKEEGKDPSTVPPIDYSEQKVWDYNPIFFSSYKDKKGKIRNENMVGHGKPINDDVMLWILSRPTFCTVRPVTYVGHQALNKNARYCYAMPFDVDMTDIQKFDQMLNLIGMGLAPKPNIIVASGHGLHVYYLLRKPIYCGSVGGSHQTLMNRFRAGFLPVIANPVTCGKVNKDGVCSPDDLPFGQGYRMPGTKTHFNEVVRAWRVEDSPLHSIMELNTYIKTTSRSSLALSIEECKSLDSSWYNSSVFLTFDKKEKSKRKKRTDAPRYNKWLYKLHNDQALCEGHRYNCIAILAYRARIDHVPFETLKKDAYDMLGYLDSLTVSNNHFTKQDIDAALTLYHSNARYSNTMEILKSGLFPSPKEKAIPHKGQSMIDHLEDARALRDRKRARKGLGDWREGNGRPVATFENSKEYAAVQRWRGEHPECHNKALCARELGLSRPTVIKWWNTSFDRINLDVNEDMEIIRPKHQMELTAEQFREYLMNPEKAEADGFDLNEYVERMRDPDRL